MWVTSLLQSFVKMNSILLVQVCWSKVTSTSKPPLLVTYQIKTCESDVDPGILDAAYYSLYQQTIYQLTLLSMKQVAIKKHSNEFSSEWPVRPRQKRSSKEERNQSRKLKSERVESGREIIFIIVNDQTPHRWTRQRISKLNEYQNRMMNLNAFTRSLKEKANIWPTHLQFIYV